MMQHRGEYKGFIYFFTRNVSLNSGRVGIILLKGFPFSFFLQGYTFPDQSLGTQSERGSLKEEAMQCWAEHTAKTWAPGS